MQHVICEWAYRVWKQVFCHYFLLKMLKPVPAVPVWIFKSHGWLRPRYSLWSFALSFKIKKKNGIFWLFQDFIALRFLTHQEGKVAQRYAWKWAPSKEVVPESRHKQIDIVYKCMCTSVTEFMISDFKKILSMWPEKNWRLYIYKAKEFPQVVQVCQVAAKLMAFPNYADCSPTALSSPISWHRCHLRNQIDHTKWWMVYAKKNKHCIWAQYTSTDCSCEMAELSAQQIVSVPRQNWMDEIVSVPQREMVWQSYLPNNKTNSKGVLLSKLFCGNWPILFCKCSLSVTFPLDFSIGLY